MTAQGPPAFRRSALRPADGTLLKSAREAKGWCRRELAKNASVAAKTIARIERGAQLPLPATLRALADALGVGLGVLAPDWSADFLESQSTDPVGPRLRALRVAAAVSLEQAAKAAGVSISTFSRFERDLHQSRSMEGYSPREGLGLASEHLAHSLGLNDADALQDALSTAPLQFDEESEN
jgi:transcriptional regulator with XRE-family HTH domain